MRPLNIPPLDDFRQRAEARYAARLHSVALRPLHDGRPLPTGTVLSCTPRRGALALGTCIDPSIADDTPFAAHWRGAVTAFADTVVAENHMKWYGLEPEADAWDPTPAERLLAWSEHAGLAVRGHCLLWSKRKFLQAWAQKLDRRAFDRAVWRHVERSVAQFRGRVTCWDVYNEQLDGRHFEDRLGEGFAVELFRRAAAVDPGVPLFVNEYGVLCNDAKCERYYTLIARLRDAGAPIGGIGIQEHQAERFVAGATAPADLHPERQGRDPLVPDDVWRRLDRLATLGLPIHITEVSWKAVDEAMRAEAAEIFLRTAAAHRAVHAFLVWGIHGRQHWLGDAGGLHSGDEWTPRPAFSALRGLRDTWTAPLSAMIGPDGLARLCLPAAGINLNAAGYQCHATITGAGTLTVAVG
jgi:endo-1,4-beta-xylanase